ncbi:MAG: hypothetical protein OXG67_04225 [bacterium]|nr:hypothetical protein [bacterium]
MGRALRAVACVTVTALLTAACGTDDDSATPDPTAAPVAATAAQVDAEPSLAPTPTPEPTLYVQSSGLACYGERSSSWNSDYFDPDLVIGVPTVDEAAALWWKKNSVGRWWPDRDGRYTIGAEDLTQHLSQDDSVAFRDAEGNAQVVLYAAQLPDGNWIIDAGAACA